MRIPRSTFYATQETTPKQLREEALVKQIAEIQNEYFFTIGRRRMGTLLNRRFGISVCETDVVLIFWTLRVQAMHIPQEIKQQACKAVSVKVLQNI